jgi:hypothetical protein
MISQVNTCQSGPFPALVEDIDIDSQDESTHKNMGETGEEAQDLGLAFDNDLVDDIRIEEDDHVFKAMVHPVNPHHFICALSTVICLRHHTHA